MHSERRYIEVHNLERKRRVRILKPQRGSYRDYLSFETSWPEDLLCKLETLKGEWFLDSYQRFEHPNYVQKQVDMVLELYGIQLHDNRVLDFGCGFGASSYCMIKRGANQIVACDLERQNTDFASDFFAGMGMADRVSVYCGDIVPTLEASSYGVIWLQAVMEHLLPEERQSYLQRFWRALRPGGVLIITETPNRVWPIEGHTTGGTWWIPWRSPESVFKKMRSESRYCSHSDVAFYRSGIIGSSYREILNCLGRPDDCEQLSLQVGGYPKYRYAHAMRRSFVRKVGSEMLNVADIVLRHGFRRPLTAFAPFLDHLAFRKRALS